MMSLMMIQCHTNIYSFFFLDKHLFVLANEKFKSVIDEWNEKICGSWRDDEEVKRIRHKEEKRKEDGVRRRENTLMRGRGKDDTEFKILQKITLLL